MKFNNLNVPKPITDIKGIGQIRMERLSNVVAFVGKNGSGKTRILDLIEENCFMAVPIERLVDNSFSHIPIELENIKSKIQQLSNYLLLNEKSQSEVNRETKLALFNEIKSSMPNPAQMNILKECRMQFSTIFPTLSKSYLKRIKNEEINNLQKAVTDLKDDSYLLFENLIDGTNINKRNDTFKSINKSALKYLMKLPNKLTFDFNDCFGDKTKYEERDSYKRFLSLKKLIKDFLGKDLTWERKVANHTENEDGVHSTYSGVWKLNNREFNYTEFSDGEKTLFAYSLFFFLLDQNTKLNVRESIIIIDEPELHLHPNSEIDLIEGIKRAIGEKGQLIIATHSINILSSLNYEDIFMVKDGKIKHPSRTTHRESLSELMGIEERISKLSDFLSSISTWSYVNFMAQCFSNPEVIESSKKHDPQIEAFKTTVRQNSNKQTNMLLDFGAGKGRVYEQIKTDYDFINKINYSALEPEQEFHSKLIEMGASNVFSSYNDIEQNSFDFILLCNVLHEILIQEWKETLNKIIQGLKPDGYLVIIEAKTLHKGEKIGETGFLLFNLEELQKLFNLKSVPSSIKSEEKDLITCAVIRKSELKEVSNENILDALSLLEINTLNEIELIMNQQTLKSESYGIGRQFAFLCKQHLNAKIAKSHLQREIQLIKGSSMSKEVNV